MANKLERIPQIIAIVPITPDGQLNLKKAVREYLGLGDQRILYLDMQTEVVLSTAAVGDQLAVDEKNRIHLPREALPRLGITERSLVGLVQRDRALAIKRVEIDEREGECARLYDRETTFQIERWAETNPLPDVLLPRVQAAQRTLTTIRWCDNAQQHGLHRGGERRCVDPYTTDEIEAIEQACIQRYQYGGIRSLKELRTADTSHTPFYLPRVAHTRAAGTDEYPLRMPDVGGGCDVMMTRALSLATDPKLRRLAQAHLWEYVGVQRAIDGSFAGYTDKTLADPQALFMQILARYDHPVAQVGLWRSFPWIVDHQNEDGSWGQEGLKDVSTLATLEALLSLDTDLPAGMRP